jgi:WhiB family redox-sensing transcriptional regulator
MVSLSTTAERQLGSRTQPACRGADPELFFAEQPQELEKAKAICGGCPLLAECLSGALSRGESAGVWGGEIFVGGQIVAFKRPRGRPRRQLLSA